MRSRTVSGLPAITKPPSTRSFQVISVKLRRPFGVNWGSTFACSVLMVR